MCREGGQLHRTASAASSAASSMEDQAQWAQTDSLARSIQQAFASVPHPKQVRARAAASTGGRLCSSVDTAAQDQLVAFIAAMTTLNTCTCEVSSILRVQGHPASHARLLVVGESRVGKTTFLKNLFASYAQVRQLPQARAARPCLLYARRASPVVSKHLLASGRISAAGGPGVLDIAGAIVSTRMYVLTRPKCELLRRYVWMIAGCGSAGG